MDLDLVIRNGRIVTAGDECFGDIGVRDGKVAAIGSRLPDAASEIDAGGRLVTPGGVDAHCHIDEPPYMNARLADDFRSASRSAACGGTTTIVPFINQLAGASLAAARDDYRERARSSLIDYGFHFILKSDDPDRLRTELPPLLANGLRSVKVFMTYDGYMMSDDAILQVMEMVRAVDGVVMVHAENGHCAHHITSSLHAHGRNGLSNFAESSPEAIEREAVHRAITLAELTGVRLMIVHVSGDQAMEQIRWSRHRGHRTLAETCPQYLVDLEPHLHSDGWETAKYVCMPPVRPKFHTGDLWRGVMAGDIDLISSDHCPYRFEGETGKKAFGSPKVGEVPPGLPGLETRLPLFYEAAVASGRISERRFVDLTATTPARLYGLYPRKGSLLPGSDADITIWETGPREIRHADLHDACDYTPYEGRTVSAWPVITLSRGEVVWSQDEDFVSDAYGRGSFVSGPAC